MKKVLWLRHKESTILFNLNNLVDQAYCMGKISFLFNCWTFA